MPRHLLSLSLISLMFAVQNAAPVEASRLMDISSVTIHEVTDDNQATQLNNDCGQAAEPLGIIGWGTVVNIGFKVWQLIEANKPVVNVQTPSASALPGGLTCWSQLDSWQAPKIQTYEVSYKNYLDMEVVKFRFRLQYNYGGGIAGRGKYLANVTVLPAELNVLWGYTFNADVDVEQAINLGTTENPVAGLGLNLKWSVATVMKQSDNSFHFFVQGDGVSTTTN